MRIQALLNTFVFCALALGGAAAAYADDVRLLVRHEVADYAAWRKVYNSVAPLQKKMGVFFKDVYVSAENPNDVTIIHDFHSLEEAKAFMASPELRASMTKAGVKPPAQVWITTKGAK
jgi:quinol monooxygenase YgiN